MLRESLISLPIALELLLHAALHSAVDALRVGLRFVAHIRPLEHEKILLMSDELRIDGIVSTPTKRKIINRIQQVGLPRTILPDKTI